MKLVHHWEDRTLLHVVEQDLRRKRGWSLMKRAVLELPACTCCEADHQHSRDESHLGPRDDPNRGGVAECRHGSHAGVLSARVEEMKGEGYGEMKASASTLVFAVNAGLSLPARRFSDVVTAAEEFLGSLAREVSGEDHDLMRRPRVLAAFCDGSSIIYYHVCTGIVVS